MDEPVVLGPGEGEQVTSRITVKGDRDEIVFSEISYGPRQPGPRVHVHKRHSDLFYVVEGEATIEVDGTVHRLAAGGFALVPPNVPHTFRNESDAPMKLVNVHAPGVNFAEYFRRLGAGGEVDSTEFDQYDAEP